MASPRHPSIRIAEALGVALGASPNRVRHAVLGRTLLLAGAGTGIGLAAALATTRLLRSMLFGVSPVDPATIAGIVVILVAVATLSGIVPARRATRADALEACAANSQTE